MRSLPRQISDTLIIMAGTGLIALAVSCVYAPMGMVTGGFTGIAIMVQFITKSMIPGGIPLGISNLLLNIPVFIWAFRRKNRRFLVLTIMATIFLSVWLMIIPDIWIIRDDFLLASLLRGAFAGVGIGMVVRAQATTGGTDLLAVLLHEKIRHRTVVEILMIIDAIIVVAGMGIFGLRLALYAMIAIFMTTKVSDRLTEGLKFAKGALIITIKEQQVAQDIMLKMERGSG